MTHTLGYKIALAKDTTRVKGQLHGVYKRWYDNGHMNRCVTFINGQDEGEYKVWWYDGTPRLNLRYMNGNLFYPSFYLKTIVKNDC